MSDENKDWGSPAFVKVYIGLAFAYITTPDESVLDWLKANGSAKFACCPDCHLEDFKHEEGCEVFKKIEVAVQIGLNENLKGNVRSE